MGAGDKVTAIGSTSPAIEESERLLQQRKEEEERKTLNTPPAPGAPRSTSEAPPGAPGARRRTATKPTAVPDENQIRGVSILIEKVGLLFLPDKRKQTKEEADLIDTGVRGIHSKFPKLFEWIPFLALVGGVAIFVLNRLSKPKNET